METVSVVNSSLKSKLSLLFSLTNQILKNVLSDIGIWGHRNESQVSGVVGISDQFLSVLSASASLWFSYSSSKSWISYQSNTWSMEATAVIWDASKCLCGSTAKHAAFICRLEDNLGSLRDQREELQILRQDVNARIQQAESLAHMRRTREVDGWLQSVNSLEQVNSTHIEHHVFKSSTNINDI